MAPKNTVFEVEHLASVGASIKIVGGPNDWDMWLCLRGTKKEVTFYIGEQAIRIAPAQDATTFFAGTITSMRRVTEVPSEELTWVIEGEVLKGYRSTAFTFKANYNVETRKGHVVFEFEKKEEATIKSGFLSSCFWEP